MAVNKNFILSGLFIFVLFSAMILNVGTDFIGSDNVVLDNKSTDYMTTYSDLLTENDITPLTEINNLSNQGILDSSDDDGEQSTADIFATINYYKSRLTNVVGYFKVFVNLPAFVIQGLGLPVEPFSAFSNIFGVVFYAFLIIIFIRLLRGS